MNCADISCLSSSSISVGRQQGNKTEVGDVGNWAAAVGLVGCLSLAQPLSYHTITIIYLTPHTSHLTTPLPHYLNLTENSLFYI